jgi:hypothetical protein
VNELLKKFSMIRPPHVEYERSVAAYLRRQTTGTTHNVWFQGAIQQSVLPEIMRESRFPYVATNDIFWETGRSREHGCNRTLRHKVVAKPVVSTDLEARVT